jgi:predicted outer membrane protein
MKITTLNKIVLTSGIFILAGTAWADIGNNQYLDSTNADAATPVSAQHFVWTAGMANLKEVRLSEMALNKSQNGDVTSFARHMIRDHTAANKKLMVIAEKENLNFPGTNFFYNRWNSNSNYTHNSDWNFTNELNAGNASNTNSMVTASSAGIGHENYKGAEIVELKNETQSVSNDFFTVESLEALSGTQFDQAYIGKMYADHVKAINEFQYAAANLTDPDLKKFAQKTLPTLREHFRMVQDLQSKLGGGQNADSKDYLTNSYSRMQMVAPQ